MNKILILKQLIQIDKITHNLSNYAILFTFAVLTKYWIGLVIALTFSFLKEFVWDKWLKKGTFEIADRKSLLLQSARDSDGCRSSCGRRSCLDPLAPRRTGDLSDSHSRVDSVHRDPDPLWRASECSSGPIRA